MKLFALTAVTALALVVKHAQSVCPESGCECGEYCVNSNNRWCNSNNDEECSCKEGCLVIDRLLTPGQEDILYCKNCSCSVSEHRGEAIYTFAGDWCIPEKFIQNIDYPNINDKNPACEEYDYDYDIDYEMTTETTDPE